MSDLSQKVQTAIDRMKGFEPEDGYYLAYSGGKDSDCIKILAYLANVKFEAVHNLTTADAPETVNYVKSQSDVRIDKARDSDGNLVTMWNLIPKKLLPPTRLARYCCSELKERGGKGKIIVSGVRWAESVRRAESSDVVQILGKPKSTQKKAEEISAEYQVTRQGGIIMSGDNDEARRLTEFCYRTREVRLNPIIDWTDSDVWEFLKYYGCRSNPLYECGFKRVGCIGCPMASKTRYTEFRLYPKYKRMYLNAFDRMLARRIEVGKPTEWKTAEDVFRWWMEEDIDQLTFDDLEG